MRNLFLGMALVMSATAATNAQTILQGNITSTTTLDQPCYLLKGCVYVKSGATLNINPGTIILGDNTPNAEGALIIERGAQINADGSTNPIVFTSAAPAGSRAPGDWGGIIIAGNGINNQPGDTFVVEGPCTPVIAGGTNVNDNSGVLRYVRIEYAGVDASSIPGGGNEINSLTLAAVGSGTTIDHIQVSYANDDAFEWFGGNVNTKYLIAYSTKDDDFDTDFGFSGKSQFGFALRKDPTQHDISGSNGIESDNMAASPFLSPAGRPKTHPIFSNYSLFGPLVCNAGPVSSEFRSGTHIRRNSAHTIYNSVITGWPVNGLLVDGSATMANTASDELNFSYNTFYNNGATNANTPTWTGCENTMSLWLNFLGTSSGCDENDNYVSPSPLGYNSSICNDGCSSLPGFTLTTNNLRTPDYSADDLSDPFFDNSADGINFRGAFGSTDWTLGWTEWCPQERSYSCNGLRAATSEEVNTLQIVPNPSNSTTYAVFNSKATGKVKLSILDKVTGQPLRVINAEITQAGEQRIAFNVAGLQLGVYTLRVETTENVFAQQLMVK